MIHYLWVIKEGLVFLFLSLSFTRFTLINKKRAFLFSFKMEKEILQRKTDTFEIIY
jgi:hypothetical protein